jgi:hypothetical protein
MIIAEEIGEITAQNGGSERDAINVLLERLKQANLTIEVQKEYIQLLVDELDDVCPLAAVHGWKTSRADGGIQAGENIYKLTSAQDCA